MNVLSPNSKGPFIKPKPVFAKLHYYFCLHKLNNGVKFNTLCCYCGWMCQTATPHKMHAVIIVL